MLPHYRRYWFPLAVLLLALPLLVFVVAPTRGGRSAEELRPLAELPPWPHTLDEWTRLPPLLDAYWRDHFGLRRPMVRAYALLVHDWLRTGSDQVFVGKNHLFYRGLDMIEQSAGLFIRTDAIAATTDTMAAAARALAGVDATLIFAPPPNSSTIVARDLPKWARNPGVPTEYDALLTALTARGLHAVDLRPVLRAEMAVGKTYFRHDNHWTPRGALAAFNVIAKAAGHDWQWPMAPTLLPRVPFVGGVEARMLGLEGRISELVEWPVLPETEFHLLSDTPPGAPPYEVVGRRQNGPTIAIVGDSFTHHLYERLLYPFVGRIIWLHYESCGFNWRLLEQERPLQVWFMPTERQMLCMPAVSPAGLLPETEPAAP